MNTKKLIIAISMLLICVITAGCIGFRHPPIVRKQYMLKSMPPKKIYAGKTDKILEVNSVMVATPYSGLGFVYRVSDLDYKKDYYNMFFSSTGQQIWELTIQHLQAEKLFAHVVGDPGIMQADYILYPRILELYADYRSIDKPMAVIVMHFTLLKADTTNVLLDKTYRQAIPFPTRNSVGLVNAWSLGVHNILDDLSRDLWRLQNKNLETNATNVGANNHFPKIWSLSP